MGKTTKTEKWKLDKMVEYYQKGMTAKEASSKVGSSIKVCLVELKKRGISIRKHTEYSSIKTPQWKLDKMVEYYNKGMSSSEAAKKFGLGYSVCINELKRRNIEIRKPGTYQSPSKDKKDKMIQNYLNGMTSYKAAESIGVSFTTCLKEIKRRGLTARNPQEYTRLSVDDNYFEKINTEEKAYWLGFIVSDGCIFGGNILHFTLKSSDKSHLEKFLKEIKYEGAARDYFTTNGHWVCKVSINSPKIYNDLLKYGITERKSLTIKPFKFKNKKLNIAYWRGIIDGDGWFTKYFNATSACGYIYMI